jgi:HD superfamily phosphohydrolase
MDERLENLTRALADAGCSRCAIEKAEKLLTSGRTQELIRHLRLCSCDLMEELHQSQKRVDRMDYLIRQTEKTQIAK